MMRFLDNGLYKLVEFLAIVFLGLIALLVILQVVFRFVFNNPLPWPEELSRVLFIYLVFIGGAVSSRSNSHISIELVDYFNFSQRSRCVLKLLRHIGTALVLIVAVYGVVQIIPNMRFMNLPATGLPIVVMFFPVGVGCALMALWTIIHMFREMRNLVQSPDDRQEDETG